MGVSTSVSIADISWDRIVPDSLLILIRLAIKDLSVA